MKLPIPPLQLKKKLAQENLVAPDRFDALLAEATRKGQNLLDILISERIVDREYLTAFLASALGVEPANFAARPIDPAAVKLLSEEVARQRQVIVFGREPSGVYDAAMADPSDLETLEFLTQHLKAKVRPFLATLDDLNRGFSIYGYELGQDFKKLIEENVQASLRGQSKNTEEAAAQLPVVAIVNNIVSYAVASRASDVHLDLLENALLIRYRIDGVLIEIMRLPKVIHAALAARIKLLSGLKIDEHYKPQDGRFRQHLGNQMIDIRVSVIPTFYGEKVEMRLLEATQKPLSLEELGMRPDVAKVVGGNLSKPYGMILSCGPTGSGKTSTLYAFVNILNRPEVNIVTIEDPIEYNMPYINQTQINPQAGVTFAEGLRALLRQDPNIIMVGEIRDSETADISVQAALTGHLLLALLHTNDAPTAIPRLFDLGVPPFLVASVLNVVVAQRLVRKICRNCIASYEAGADVQKLISDELKTLNLETKAQIAPKLLYRGKGCHACTMTGYRGRIGIFEVLVVTDTMKKLITDPRFDLEAVRQKAHEEGTKTMFEDGVLKAEVGLTTIEEVLRVIRE
ncbi:type II/IV secretion system protein [Candidatus Parcubacteria bacterium]|nr:MAG: type II/IV secretion system protein [Candidatus Parcubacteria bacterium]